MRCIIVSDAWAPQINGVVRTLTQLKSELEKQGHEIITITPNLFRTIPCPTYPEIRLSLFIGKKVGKMIEAARPSAIHIATEGPLGMAARRYCVKNDIPFTTAFHTLFAEYVKARTRLPLSVGYAFLKWFHKPSKCLMVATQTLEDSLKSRGFQNIKRWSRGIDTDLFHPREKLMEDLPRPIFMYVGRMAIEKNIEAFLDLDLPGSKVVVGDGPQRAQLEVKYPKVYFLGMKEGEDLAAHYASADVFVFPSRTDTFGLVLLEALASGVPVAAYPVTGPLDVIGNSDVGVLDEDLARAAQKALTIDPDACRAFALQYTWEKSANQFFGNLAPFGPSSWHFPPIST
ncbi:glycosyltransferase [Sneathiella sp. P13V-1]|uniref:glycosyltransferase family 4 protein n=1 Tax=Sneathiella sp. P13V-1 TaxID=2697366 RepID=UPI00187B69A8|nr:glycosyltransferase family 1 protein [Sneathiella sp. P13V-1]MBE7636373.1 glycosyltransferase [Sneathiella sp. P13V-1]